VPNWVVTLGSSLMIPPMSAVIYESNRTLGVCAMARKMTSQHRDGSHPFLR
jgi:hypothetical protein